MTRPDSFTIELPKPGASDGEMLAWMGIDAVRWARVFQRNVENLPDDADPDAFGAMLIGWFANAIGAGEMESGAKIADLQAALEAAQDEIRTLRYQHAALHETLDATYRDAWAMLDGRQDALQAAQDEIERLKGEKEALRERLEWEQPEPDDDVIGVDDHTAPDNEQDGYTWGRVHKAGEGGPHSEWKGYKNGGKVYLDWPELVRRWGPLTVSSRLSTCPPCSTGDHSNHRAELADCCIGCACEVTS